VIGRYLRAIGAQTPLEWLFSNVSIHDDGIETHVVLLEIVVRSDDDGMNGRSVAAFGQLIGETLEDVLHRFGQLRRCSSIRVHDRDGETSHSPCDL
jgi:hypothetical protein